LLAVQDEPALTEFKSKRLDFLIDSGIANVQSITLCTSLSVAMNLLDNFFQYRHDMDCKTCKS